MTVIPLHPEGPQPLPPSPEGALVSPRGERRDTEPSGAPTRVTVVGDALLDIDIRGEVERICPDSPVPVLDEHDELARPGGAALAAALAARAGAEVTLVTALGRDTAGRRLTRLLEAEGVSVCDLGLAGPTPEKVRLVAAGQRLLRLDRGGGPSPVRGRSMGEAADAVAAGHAVVVSDYGRGLTAYGPLLRALAARAGRRRPSLVWDPHPRGVAPVPGVALVTPSAAEATAFAPGPEGQSARGEGGAGGWGVDAVTGVDLSGLAGDAARARTLQERWRVRGVVVTRGRRGAVLAVGAGSPLVVPGRAVEAADTCGAGDAFAVHAALALAAGRTLPEAVEDAVGAAGAFVAAGAAGAVAVGGGTAPRAPGAERITGGAWRTGSADDQVLGAEGAAGGAWRTGSGGGGPTEHDGGGAVDDPFELARAVRAAGGTVVATGGCFDLLHAGHVDLLRQARRLGDVLIVCLNADRSVRRLKGDGRPLQPEHDRRAVLLALDAVDAVAVFDDDTPVGVLSRLRPHVFVKGGDYAGVEIPEAALCAGWGGTAVTVPYLSGRSTSGLVELARRGR